MEALETITLKSRIKHGCFTADALTSGNPILLAGEVVYESDTHKFKVGDGVTAWRLLPYYSDVVNPKMPNNTAIVDEISAYGILPLWRPKGFIMGIPQIRRDVGKDIYREVEGIKWKLKEFSPTELECTVTHKSSNVTRVDVSIGTSPVTLPMCVLFLYTYINAVPYRGKILRLDVGYMAPKYDADVLDGKQILFVKFDDGNWNSPPVKGGFVDVTVPATAEVMLVQVGADDNKIIQHTRTFKVLEKSDAITNTAIYRYSGTEWLRVPFEGTTIEHKNGRVRYINGRKEKIYKLVDAIADTLPDRFAASQLSEAPIYSYIRSTCLFVHIRNKCRTKSLKVADKKYRKPIWRQSDYVTLPTSYSSTEGAYPWFLKQKGFEGQGVLYSVAYIDMFISEIERRKNGTLKPVGRRVYYRGRPSGAVGAFTWQWTKQKNG